MEAVISSSTSFAGVTCIREIVVLEVDYSNMIRIRDGPLQNDFKYRIYTYQETYTAEECSGTELNSQSVKVMAKSCYLVGTILPLITRTGLSLELKDRLSTECTHSVMLYVRLDKLKTDVIRLQKNDTRIIR